MGRTGRSEDVVDAEVDGTTQDDTSSLGVAGRTLHAIARQMQGIDAKPVDRAIAAGRPTFGRFGLVLLCLAGVRGTLFILLLLSVTYALHVGEMGFGRSSMAIQETLLLGFWTCLAGYGLLIVGALLFGYPFSVPRRREAP
jgi:hypothetical protein